MEQDRQNQSPFWDRPEQSSPSSGPSENRPNQNPSPFWSRPGQDGNGTPAQQFHRPKEEPANGLARASKVLGIFALVSFFTFTVYPPIIFGSLSIILALLSRGSSLKMHSKAQNGVITSSIALGCDVAIFAMAFALIFNMGGSFESIYGMSYEEMIEGMENGTLDYEDIYNNVYENMYENMYGDTYEDSYEELYEHMPEDMRQEMQEMQEIFEQMP